MLVDPLDYRILRGRFLAHRRTARSRPRPTDRVLPARPAQSRGALGRHVRQPRRRRDPRDPPARTQPPARPPRPRTPGLHRGPRRVPAIRPQPFRARSGGTARGTARRRPRGAHHRAAPARPGARRVAGSSAPAGALGIGGRARCCGSSASPTRSRSRGSRSPPTPRRSRSSRSRPSPSAVPWLVELHRLLRGSPAPGTDAVCKAVGTEHDLHRTSRADRRHRPGRDGLATWPATSPGRAPVAVHNRTVRQDQRCSTSTATRATSSRPRPWRSSSRPPAAAPGA